MPEGKFSKVTVSLPRELLDLADRLARERSTTRSGVIADLLAREDAARTEALMAEGYREMAEEDRRLAEEALPLIAETFMAHTRWDEDTDG
jgi:metal-responsive CopG/Arc/MetJ family transcriptional regulator